jgi:hypothetical protein
LVDSVFIVRDYNYAIKDTKARSYYIIWDSSAHISSYPLLVWPNNPHEFAIQPVGRYKAASLLNSLAA